MDLVNNEINFIENTNCKEKTSEELKKAAETIGLDLTKNLSNIIYII
jgi:hypothetical protein